MARVFNPREQPAENLVLRKRLAFYVKRKLKRACEPVHIEPVHIKNF